MGATSLDHVKGHLDCIFHLGVGEEMATSRAPQ